VREQKLFLGNGDSPSVYCVPTDKIFPRGTLEKHLQLTQNECMFIVHAHGCFDVPPRIIDQRDNQHIISHTPSGSVSLGTKVKYFKRFSDILLDCNPYRKDGDKKILLQEDIWTLSQNRKSENLLFKLEGQNEGHEKIVRNKKYFPTIDMKRNKETDELTEKKYLPYCQKLYIRDASGQGKFEHLDYNLRFNKGEPFVSFPAVCNRDSRNTYGFEYGPGLPVCRYEVTQNGEDEEIIHSEPEKIDAFNGVEGNPVIDNQHGKHVLPITMGIHIMIPKGYSVTQLISLKDRIDELVLHGARYTTPMMSDNSESVEHLGVHSISPVSNGDDIQGSTVIENDAGMEALINKYENRKFDRRKRLNKPHYIFLTFPENTSLKVSEIMRPSGIEIPGTWYLEMCKSGDDWVSTIQTSMAKQLHFGPQEKIEQHGFSPLARELSSTQHKTDAGIPDFLNHFEFAGYVFPYNFPYEYVSLISEQSEELRKLKRNVRKFKTMRTMANRSYEYPEKLTLGEKDRQTFLNEHGEEQFTILLKETRKIRYGFTETSASVGPINIEVVYETLENPRIVSVFAGRFVIPNDKIVIVFMHHLARFAFHKKSIKETLLDKIRSVSSESNLQFFQNVFDGVVMTDRGILKINIWLRNVLQGIFAMPVEERNTSLIVLITYISFKNKPSEQDTEPETDGRPRLGDDSLENPPTFVFPMGLFLGHDFVLPLNIGDDYIPDFSTDFSTVETRADAQSSQSKNDTSNLGVEGAVSL